MNSTAATTPNPGNTSIMGTSKVPAKVVAATVASNAIEFFDFVTYAFFAVYIGKAFFPSATAYGSLLLSVAVFGVGFVFRPIGGIVIGAFADRAGRRPALMLTIALVTAGTLGLAVTPSYDSIGIAAPIIIVICRLVQGLALGGAVGPSTAFLIEAAPRNRRGFYGSWQLASQGGATLVAGLMGVALTLSLSPADLQAWGWRVPFFFGLLLIPIALFLMKQMPETLHHGGAAKKASAPVSIKNYTRILVLTVLAIMGGTISTYLGNYMTTYAITTLKLPGVMAMGATVIVGLMTLIFSLVGGWLSDRFGRRPTMFWPRVAAALLTVPAFTLLINNPSLPVLLAVAGFLATLTAISGAASIIAIPEMFPRQIRATGMAIAYAVGVSLFGGTTQYIVTWLISATGNPAAPAWYVAATSVITAIAMYLLPETVEGLPEDKAA